MQRIYIDLGSDPPVARAALSGTAAPTLAGLLGNPLDVSVAFFRNNEQEALAASSTGKFTLKDAADPTGEAVFLDATMTAEGTGAATTYKFSGILSSDELIALLGSSTEPKTLKGVVSWTEPDEDEVKCLDFDFTVHNSSARPEDSIPATTEARWEWLKEAAPEANGFTHDEETKTISAAGITEESDPVASAALTTHAARTDNPHSVTKSQVGLGNCDNTSDADKPVSTAQQAALDAKEPTQTAASQAEAEAGAEAAIRKWSPLRIKQAIDALGGGGGGSITTPKVLHITTAGNDTTGDGSPGTPYATAQKAFDIAFAGTGNYVLMFGVGNFGTVLCPSGWPERIAVAGVGLYVSAINSIQGETPASAGSNGQVVKIRGNGAIALDDVSVRGATGATSSMGGTGGSIELWGVGYSALSARGGDGGAESSPSAGDGGSGGEGGTIVLHRCIDIGGGEKSALGGGGGPGGTPGTDGTITDLLGEHRVAGNWSGGTRYAHLCLLNSGDSTAWTSADNTDTCSTY